MIALEVRLPVGQVDEEGVHTLRGVIGCLEVGLLRRLTLK
jgi:hypothetical protein